MKKPRICTIGSHSALNILRGAMDEGFSTLLICKKGTAKFYESFGICNETIEINEYADIYDIQAKFDDCIIIPHGSFVAYYDLDRLMKEFNIPIFGNKRMLDWESDRRKKSELMKAAGLRLPREFERPEDVDRPVIVKHFGAHGGQGFYIARTPEELFQRINATPEEKEKPKLIQELIRGTNIYPSFFRSVIRNRTELFCVDRRYESDVDSSLGVFFDESNPTFTIVGNYPLVLRESLAVQVQKDGENFIDATKRLVPPGLNGAFCLEMVVDRDLKVYTFEFSGRIVAGTNFFVPYSPYSYVMWGEAMSMGRRIAREIKDAFDVGRIDEICF
nr:formate--phosphoribosylaminoimidazolecarboxamide ligase [Candidatus Sigynarchaeota archaeon]